MQLNATVEALRLDGIDAVASTWQDAPGETDVVHLYNLQLPFLLAKDILRARSRWPGAKIVISPIFWPPDLIGSLRTRDPRTWRRAVKATIKTWSTWQLSRHALAAADAVLTLSGAELELLGRYFRIKPRDTWVPAPGGVWIENWQSDSREQRSQFLEQVGITSSASTTVACVARIEPGKNQLLLVEALAGLEACSLLLIGPRGEEGYSAKVLERAEVLLPSRWAWLGPVSHTEMPRILQSVDVHALPSLREVASLVTLEAAAAGCEIVVADKGPAREYFGDDAHYCVAHSVADIARAIQEAIQHPKQPKLRARAEGFDWSVTGRLVGECYRRICGRKQT